MDEKVKQICYRQHMYSRGFSGEFHKYFLKDSVLSREIVIRVLILLMLPDLDEKVLGSNLEELGYAPLNGEREMAGYVDYAISSLLQFCADLRNGDRVRDRREMQKVLRTYDMQLMELPVNPMILRKLRFMKFRSIGNDIEG